MLGVIADSLPALRLIPQHNWAFFGPRPADGGLCRQRGLRQQLFPPSAGRAGSLGIPLPLRAREISKTLFRCSREITILKLYTYSFDCRHNFYSRGTCGVETGDQFFFYFFPDLRPLLWLQTKIQCVPGGAAAVETCVAPLSTHACLTLLHRARNHGAA